MQKFSRLLFVASIAGLPLLSTAQTARLPNEEEVKGIMTLCGGGRSRQISAQVLANFKKFKEGLAIARTSASHDDIAAIFTKIDIGGEELMRIYAACVKDQTKIFLESKASRLDEKYRPLAALPLAPLLFQTQHYSAYIEAIATRSPIGPPATLTPHEFPLRRLTDDRGRVKPHESTLSSTGCAVASRASQFNVYFPADANLAATLRQCFGSDEVRNELRRALTDWNGLAASSFDALQTQVGKPIRSQLVDCAEARSDIPRQYLGRIELRWEPNPPARTENVDSLLCHIAKQSPQRWSDRCNGGEAGAAAFDRIKTEYVLAGLRTTDRATLRAAHLSSIRQLGIPSGSEVAECLERNFDFLTN